VRGLGIPASDYQNMGVCESLVELRIAMALAMGRRKRRGNDYPPVNIVSFFKA